MEKENLSILCRISILALYVEYQHWFYLYIYIFHYPSTLPLSEIVFVSFSAMVHLLSNHFDIPKRIFLQKYNILLKKISPKT